MLSSMGKRKERKIGIKTMAELKDLFGLFGLSLSVSDHTRTDGYKTLEVVSPTGDVAVCCGWDQHDFVEKLQFTLRPEDLESDETMAFVAESVIKSLSTKKCLYWRTSVREAVPFGSKVTRTETSVDLPDFSSVEELKLLMAVKGGAE